ncbi:glycosyltransferase family 2 protein [Marinivivus vitaminiproducens]|uniref:glycosyltransferase family 2 protein n=1 Tax=Marinivivus vitaminiproducens TaxID=3035935 RepID=UPI0027A4C03A|nr:glycosyltransferase family 2 protein [Geminicoccaceae bacterium SCSIO 64248]
MPKITVGLVVYNGADYVAQAIRSVLAQTFDDFELIILDNASSDGTEAICRELAATDPRIRYERRPENVGVARNFNGCIERARGQYLQWLCHDDLVAPTFLERTVAVLDERSDVVLAFGQTRLIDEAGEPLRPGPGDNVFIDRQGHRRNGPPPADLATQDSAAARFLDVKKRMIRNFHLFGLHRLDVIRQTMQQQPIYGADMNLVAEVALYGKFHEVPEDLFFKREHAKQSLAIPTAEGRAKWLNPAAQVELFPHLKLLRLDARGILTAPIPLKDKIKLMGWVVRHLGLKQVLLNPRHWRRAYMDQETIY